MSDNSGNVMTEDPSTDIVVKIRLFFHIPQLIGMIIELIFLFVMIKNWYQKNIFLKSAFFYLLTLKTVNDFFYLLYTLAITYWDSTRYIYEATAIQYFMFILEVDIFSQFAIAINRFTALMIPLKHKIVSLHCIDIYF